MSSTHPLPQSSLLYNGHLHFLEEVQSFEKINQRDLLSSSTFILRLFDVKTRVHKQGVILLDRYHTSLTLRHHRLKSDCYFMSNWEQWRKPVSQKWEHSELSCLTYWKICFTLTYYHRKESLSEMTQEIIPKTSSFLSSVSSGLARSHEESWGSTFSLGKSTVVFLGFSCKPVATRSPHVFAPSTQWQVKYIMTTICVMRTCAQFQFQKCETTHLESMKYENFIPGPNLGIVFHLECNAFLP